MYAAEFLRVAFIGHSNPKEKVCPEQSGRVEGGAGGGSALIFWVVCFWGRSLFGGRSFARAPPRLFFFFLLAWIKIKEPSVRGVPTRLVVAQPQVPARDHDPGARACLHDGAEEMSGGGELIGQTSPRRPARQSKSPRRPCGCILEAFRHQVVALLLVSDVLRFAH